MPIGKRIGNKAIYTVRIAGSVGNAMAFPPSGAPNGRSRADGLSRYGRSEACSPGTIAAAGSWSGREANEIRQRLLMAQRSHSACDRIPAHRFHSSRESNRACPPEALRFRPIDTPKALSLNSAHTPDALRARKCRRRKSKADLPPFLRPTSLDSSLAHSPSL
jgi:hypothetical protein